MAGLETYNTFFFCAFQKAKNPILRDVLRTKGDQGRRNQGGKGDKKVGGQSPPVSRASG